MTDPDMARLGRNLADALRYYARERTPDSLKAVAALETELCAARRAEEAALAAPAAAIAEPAE